MMARMLSQLPLPLLPPGAAEIAPGVSLLAGEDGGLVAVHGLAAFAWDAGDEAGRRLAAVQLVRLRAASQGQVAEAFGVDPATIWRWDQALACGEVAGLVPVRRGPKGASKLTPALAARIAGLDAAGQTLRQIAAATGVSTFTVRAALGRVRPGGQAPAAGGEAGQGSGQPARTLAPGRCAPVSRMAATSTARKIRNSRSSTSSSIQAITPPRLFPQLLMHPAKQRRGHLSGSPCSIARGGTVAHGTRSPRQRDGGVRGRGEQLPTRRLGRHPPTVLPLPAGQRVSGHHHLAERDGAVAGDRHQRGRFHLDD